MLDETSLNYRFNISRNTDSPKCFEACLKSCSPVKKEIGSDITPISAERLPKKQRASAIPAFIHKATKEEGLNGFVDRMQESCQQSESASPAQTNHTYRLCGDLLSIRDALLEKCRQICAKIQPKEEINCEAEHEILYHPIKFDSIDQLPLIALKSKQESKSVQQFLLNLSEKRLREATRVFHPHIPVMIFHETGFYILRSLIKCSEEFREVCEDYCLFDFKQVVSNKFSIRVLKSMLHSVPFCIRIVELFEQYYHLFWDNMQATLILSMVISNCPDDSHLSFFVTNMIKYLGLGKENQAIRILSSVVDKCSVRNLRSISRTVAPHLRWLVDHRLGIFGVQSLMKKGDAQTIKKVCQICLESPVNMMVKKNRRYIFLEVLRSLQGEKTVFELLLRSIFSHRSHLEKIAQREDSTWLLVALIWVASLEDPKNLHEARHFIRQFQLSSRNPEKVEKNLALLLDILELSSSQKILDLIQSPT